MKAGRRIEIRGVVQGVGFRPFVYRLATRNGLAGRVRNDATGVTIEAFGPEDALDDLERGLTGSPPPAADILELRSSAIPVEPLDEFLIDRSQEAPERRVGIPPDLATCPSCIAEILDPADRRHRYPFTTCTNCGPRFTIVRDVPYDRTATTMAPFELCGPCRQEYEDVADRRFHAETNACPICGPRLALTTPHGRVLDCDDPIAAAAQALLAGRVVAIKGVGGFHLACDATSPEVVQRLRLRKRRDEKPFAVMVRDLEEADQVSILRPSERQLLVSVERPIVLVERRSSSSLASNVAPNNPLVGLLLPYTPLHHLLMKEVRRPLVMTSGNLSEEPLARANDEALERLRNIADLYLMHNRDIETPCDDSVARIIADRPVLVRRARGYVPAPLSVRFRFTAPVLACGGLLKNTFCIGTGNTVYLGPHVGDLENLETCRSFEESVARMERLLRVKPAIIAHDLHPEYQSTTYARARPEAIKIGVQHHHAHVVSAMVEHDLDGPVIGVAYDGTGYGSDGAAWGGEVMVARIEKFDRIGTLRPVALAGGDAAIRQPWRVALALVEDAFDGRFPVSELALFDAVPARDLRVVHQMLAARFRSPLAHGLGRYFDGIGALVLARPESRYEGQIALEWNGVADPADDRSYGYSIDRSQSPWVIDLRQMVRGVVEDLIGGVASSAISARFHNTIVAATAETVRAVSGTRGALPVVLTGGCFQNPRLAEGLVDQLSSTFAVYLHRRVPPGDGGLALGQAVVANALARRMTA